MIYYSLYKGEKMKRLKKIIEESNQNADFIGDYDKNKKLKKKLFWIGSPIAITGFVIALTAFILIGVFGSNLKSINSNTALLISMFVLLIVFSVVFGFGLYILKQGSLLHLKKQEVVIENKEEIKEEVK